MSAPHGVGGATAHRAGAGEAAIAGRGAASHPYLRPKDAATLVVLRRDRDAVRVLMGRRSDAHVFMPDMVVFPGGRVDRIDRFAPSADALHPVTEAKLLTRMGARASPSRARAIALAALREAFEEAGLLVGRRGRPSRPVRDPAWSAYVSRGVVPVLSELRLVARAVTPPGRSRRFDARFLALFADETVRQVDSAGDELLSLQWLTFAEARRESLPRITGCILRDLEARLAADPNLDPAGPVPFHYMRHGRPVCDML